MKPLRSCTGRLPMLLVSLVTGAALAAGWPALPVPQGAQAVNVGQAMSINGLPVQMRGFLSPQPVSELTTWFQTRLGSPLVISHHGGKTILGQARDGYYLTVQLETVGGGTRGLTAQTDVRAMMAGRDASLAADAGWQSRLPAGMRILSLVEARDGARRSQHLVLRSHEALANSSEALTRLLAMDRYTPGGSVASSSPPGLILHFHGPGREATAVVTRDIDGTTSTVLSTSAQIESTR